MEKKMSQMKTPIHLYLAGDSTVANCPEHESPMAGWGQLFQTFFTEDVVVHNHAKGGASLKSFLEEGRLQNILDNIKPNDYLFIQFGHNDQKIYGPDLYQSYLRQYVADAREKAAIPVLTTSVHRRNFDPDGKLVNTLGEFPNSAIEISKTLEVPLINLWEKTAKLYQSLGPDSSKQLFTWFSPNEHPNYPDGIQDNTHFCEEGAREIGKLVIHGIKELELPFERFIIQ
jgi:lysophospholipase L1-like esterase